MSKGSPVVSVRLPHDVHEWCQERANAQHETLSAYLRRQIIRFHAHSLAQAQDAQKVSTPDDAVTPVVTPECKHPRSRQVREWGQRECLDCRALYVPERPS